MCGRRSSVSGRKENLPVRTPCTQQNPRFAMSARKMRMKASMQLKMIESQELQASRLAQVKWEVWMDKQERAYGVLLNEILKQPMDPNVKVMEIKHSMGFLARSSGHGVGIQSLSFDSGRNHLRISGRNLPGTALRSQLFCIDFSSYKIGLATQVLVLCGITLIDSLQISRNHQPCDTSVRSKFLSSDSMPTYHGSQEIGVGNAMLAIC